VTDQSETKESGRRRSEACMRWVVIPTGEWRIRLRAGKRSTKNRLRCIIVSNGTRKRASHLATGGRMNQGRQSTRQESVAMRP
jgi:hypothetical protein